MSKYYTPPPQAVDGFTAFAADVNDISNEVDAGFTQVEADIDNILVDAAQYAQEAEDWATSLVEVEPGLYGARYYSQQAAAQVVLAQAEVANAAAQVVLASGYADDAAASASEAEDLKDDIQLLLDLSYPLGTSITSNFISPNAAKTFTTQTGLTFIVGLSALITYNNDPTNYWMHGRITAYNPATGSITIQTDEVSGSGTYTNWTIATSSPYSPSSGLGDTTFKKSVTIDQSTTGATLTLKSGSTGKVLDIPSTTRPLAIDSTGKLGVGTGSPTNRLTISDNTDTPALIQSSIGGSYLSFKDSSSTTGASIGAVGNNLVFSAAGAEKMRVLSTGLVGINTTNPTMFLEISSSTASVNMVRVGHPSLGHLRIRQDSFAPVLEMTNTIGTVNTRIHGSGKCYFASGSFFGINDTNPLRMLHVDSNTSQFVARFASGQSMAFIEFEGLTTTVRPYIGAETDTLSFYTNDIQRMYIDSSGSIRNGSGQVLFHQGNILGTTTQSGGVPTGNIIERGSNANGEYVKFADGTMIAYKDHTTASGSNILGAMFVSNNEVWTFPVAFVNVPSVSGKCGAGSPYSWFGGTNVGDSASICNFRIFCPNPVTSTSVKLMAIGRWF